MLLGEDLRPGRSRDPLEAWLFFVVVDANVRLVGQTPEHQSEAHDGRDDRTGGRQHKFRIPSPCLYGSSAEY